MQEESGTRRTCNNFHRGGSLVERQTFIPFRSTFAVHFKGLNYFESKQCITPGTLEIGDLVSSLAIDARARTSSPGKS